jgi:uncharacterized protein
MADRTPEPARSTPRRVLWETLAVMFVSLGLGLLDPGLKIFSILIPAAYLIIERHLRKRRWGELGFDIKGIPKALKANWVLIVLVSFGMQALPVFATRAFLPEFITHVVERLPISIHNGWLYLVPALLLSTLGEEIIYRGFFQERLSWFVGAPLAVVSVSIIFALMHFSSGSFWVVVVDLGLIFIDSLFYGAIFARSKNVFVAWFAHALADIIAMALIVM